MKQQTKNLHFKTFNPLKSRPLNTPIFQTSTFYFDSLQQADDIFSLKERNFVYTRGGNPTVNMLEDRLAELEGGRGAVCFSSGMGAISSVLMSLLKPGDVLVASDVLYGSSAALINNILQKYGVIIKTMDLSDEVEYEKYVKNNKGVKAVFFETPCNPTLKLIDIKKISQLTKKYQPTAKVVVDNTFLTPYVQTPLALGADIVVHSLTKYLNGHGDALGGVAIAKDQDYIDLLKFGYMCDLGTVMDPNSAFLILRGLKTLDVRMDKHQKSALKVAQFLEKHPKVKSVIYPGLSGYKYSKVAKKQMTGNGAIISFYLHETQTDKIEAFIKKLKLFALAVSLGDAESLIQYPLYMTHREYLKHPDSDSYRQLQSLIRMSIGLEDVDDLIEDISRALEG